MYEETVAEIQKEASESLNFLTSDVIIPWLGR